MKKPSIKNQIFPQDVNLNNIKSDGLNEDILTKHLLKLNEIEDQFRQLTNKFEEVNFKLDKLSTRVTKIQSDTQLRFSDLESGENLNLNKKKVNLPGTSKPQDFGANPGYETTKLPTQQTLNSVDSAQTVITEEPEKKIQYCQTNQLMNNMNLQLAL